MESFESYEIHYESISNLINQDSMPILSLTDSPLQKLDKFTFKYSSKYYSEWRSTICIHRKGNIKLQGEIQPFPEKATLLSFSIHKMIKLKTF